MFKSFHEIPSVVKGQVAVTVLATIAYIAMFVVIAFSGHINDYYRYTGPVQAAPIVTPAPAPQPVVATPPVVTTVPQSYAQPPVYSPTPVMNDSELAEYLRSTLGVTQGTMYYQASRDSVGSAPTYPPVKFLTQL